MHNFYLNIRFNYINYIKLTNIHIKFYHLNKYYSTYIKPSKNNYSNLSININYHIKYQINLFYIEINNYPIRLDLTKLLNNHHIVNNDDLNIQFSFIKTNSVLNNKILFIPSNINLLLNNQKKFLYFPKYQTLLPEWQSQTNIFYMTKMCDPYSE